MKKYWTLLANPFERIAGMQALAWGVAGMLVSTLLCGVAGYHYHGLLHYGPANNPAWWCYLAEHLIIWLLPAALFYLGGILLSRSRIRPIDVAGTVLFAQLPLLFNNLIELLPPMQRFNQIDFNQLATSPRMMEEMQTLMAEPFFRQAVYLGILLIPFIVLMLVWMFKALKVSCNLKGGRLWGVYLVGILVGDFLCRQIIGWLY